MWDEGDFKWNSIYAVLVFPPDRELFMPTLTGHISKNNFNF